MLCGKYPRASGLRQQWSEIIYLAHAAAAWAGLVGPTRLCSTQSPGGFVPRLEDPLGRWCIPCVQRVGLTVGWNSARTKASAPLPDCSEGCSGFLTESWLGFKRQCPQRREAEVRGACMTQSRRSQCHFCATLFLKAVTKAHSGLRGGIDATFLWESRKTLEEQIEQEIVLQPSLENGTHAIKNTVNLKQ